MKAFIFPILAIGSLFVSAIANPIDTMTEVAKRDVTVDGLNGLLASVKAQTAKINATVAGLSFKPSNADQETAVAKIQPYLSAIADALNEYSSKPVKRSFDHGPGGGGHPDLIAVVSILISEILCTVKALLVKIGLGKILFCLQPLVIALVGLLRSLDTVVAGLLLAVNVIVDELLTAIGLGLLGLKF